MNFIARCAIQPAACLKPSRFLIGFVRSVETTANENEEIALSATEDEETKALREVELEKRRNKSRLYPDHYAIYHGENPYPEPLYEYHHSLRHQRRSFGKYGEASRIDPSVIWPTKEELSLRKEYEAVAFPFTIQEMVAKIKTQKDEELRIKQAREADILSKVVKVEQWKKEFHEKVRKKAAEATAAKLKRDRLVEEIRRHFGFKIDPKDDRFKEMLEKKEKEERKLKKAERQKARDKLLVAQAEEAANTKKDEEVVQQKVEKIDDDSDDETPTKKK